ncbi:hypothetical protein V8E36_008820 [Tilletia maclaganii]
MAKEMQQFLERSRDVHVLATDVEACDGLPNSIPSLVKVYRQELPLLCQFFDVLLSKERGDLCEGGEAEHDGERLTRIEQIMVPAISALLYTRNRLANRFQMFVGAFLAVTDAPDVVKRFLQRAGLSVSPATSRAALESISDAGAPRARMLMAKRDRIKVFLFDKINIYMRRAQVRLTDYIQAAALTMRMIYSLPAYCTPNHFNRRHVDQLQAADRSSLTMGDITPASDFIEQANVILIAENLLGVAELGKKERVAIERRLQEMRQTHAKDVIEPEPIPFVSMKLMRENEGTLEGILAVLVETMKELGVQTTSQQNEAILTARDLLSVRNTLAVQDAGSFEASDTVQRLDYIWPVSGPWHLLQTWVYLVFKVHFPAKRAGKEACLDWLRELLRRPRTALR